MIEMLLASEIKLEGQTETRTKTKKNEEELFSNLIIQELEELSSKTQDPLAFLSMMVNQLEDNTKDFVSEDTSQMESELLENTPKPQGTLVKPQDQEQDVLRTEPTRFNPKEISLLEKIAEEVDSKVLSAVKEPERLDNPIIKERLDTAVDKVPKRPDNPVDVEIREEFLNLKRKISPELKQKTIEERVIPQDARLKQVREPEVYLRDMESRKPQSEVRQISVDEIGEEELKLASKSEKAEFPKEMAKNDSKVGDVPLLRDDYSSKAVSVERSTTSVKEPLAELHFDKQTWVEDLKQTYTEMIKKAELKNTDGQYQMKLQLKPEYLGKMDVIVELKNGVVETKFIVESEQVKQLLTGQLQEIRVDNPMQMQIQVREPISFNNFGELFERRDRDGYQRQRGERKTPTKTEIKQEEVIVSGLDIFA